jgi:hypothetical protein
MRRDEAVPQPHLDHGPLDVVVEHSEEAYGFDAVPNDAGVCDMYLQVSLGLHVHLHSGILGRGGERHDLRVVLHRPGLDEGEVNLGVVGADPGLLLADGSDRRDQETVLVEVRQLAEDGERVIRRDLLGVVGCTRSMSFRSSPLMVAIFGSPSTVKRHSSSKIGNCVPRRRPVGVESSYAKCSSAERMF